MKYLWLLLAAAFLGLSVVTVINQEDVSWFTAATLMFVIAYDDFIKYLKG